MDYTKWFKDTPPTIEECLEVVKEVLPIPWIKYNVIVIGDGYLPNGVRVHVIEEPLPKQPILVDNAVLVNKIK